MKELKEFTDKLAEIVETNWHFKDTFMLSFFFLCVNLD
jgi:hypothetical protein